MNTTKRVIAAILETALRIIILLIVVSFVYKAGNRAYDFGYRIFDERPMTLGGGRDVIITVPEDKSAREIGELLRQHGLIRDANLFFCQELLSAYHGKLKKGGTFTLNTGMTSVEMMAVMAGADVEEEEDKEGSSSSGSDEDFDEDSSDEKSSDEEAAEEESSEEKLSDEDSQAAESSEDDGKKDKKSEKKKSQDEEGSGEKKSGDKKSEAGDDGMDFMPEAGAGKLPADDALSPKMIEAEGDIDVIDAVIERN